MMDAETLSCGTPIKISLCQTLVFHQPSWRVEILSNLWKKFSHPLDRIFLWNVKMWRQKMYHEWTPIHSIWKTSSNRNCVHTKISSRICQWNLKLINSFIYSLTTSSYGRQTNNWKRWIWKLECSEVTLLGTFLIAPLLFSIKWCYNAFLHKWSIQKKINNLNL